jgi:hypothetical protein
MKVEWYERAAIWFIVAFIAWSLWKGLEQSAQEQRCQKAAAALPADQFVQAALKCH